LKWIVVRIGSKFQTKPKEKNERWKRQRLKNSQCNIVRDKATEAKGAIASLDPRKRFHTSSKPD
jgi:hypothetical protein